MALSNLGFVAFTTTGLGGKCMVLDVANDSGYCSETNATSTTFNLSKFTISTMAYVSTVVGTVALNNNGQDRASVIDLVNNFAYFGTGGGSVHKVNTNPAGFAYVSRLAVSANPMQGACIDAAGGFAYFVDNVNIYRITLSTFTVTSTVLITGGTPGSIVRDPATNMAYIGLGGNGSLIKVVAKFDLTAMSQITTLSMTGFGNDAGTDAITGAEIDSANDWLFFTDDKNIYKVNLTAFTFNASATLIVIGAVIRHNPLMLGNGFLYIGRSISTAILKVRETDLFIFETFVPSPAATLQSALKYTSNTMIFPFNPTGPNRAGALKIGDSGQAAESIKGTCTIATEPLTARYLDQNIAPASGVSGISFGLNAGLTAQQTFKIGKTRPAGFTFKSNMTANLPPADPALTGAYTLTLDDGAVLASTVTPKVYNSGGGSQILVVFCDVPYSESPPIIRAVGTTIVAKVSFTNFVGVNFFGTDGVDVYPDGSSSGFSGNVGPEDAMVQTFYFGPETVPGKIILEAVKNEPIVGKIVLELTATDKVNGVCNVHIQANSPVAGSQTLEGIQTSSVKQSETLEVVATEPVGSVTDLVIRAHAEVAGKALLQGMSDSPVDGSTSLEGVVTAEVGGQTVLEASQTSRVGGIALLQGVGLAPINGETTLMGFLNEPIKGGASLVATASASVKGITDVVFRANSPVNAKYLLVGTNTTGEVTDQFSPNQEGDELSSIVDLVTWLSQGFIPTLPNVKRVFVLVNSGSGGSRQVHLSIRNNIVQGLDNVPNVDISPIVQEPIGGSQLNQRLVFEFDPPVKVTPGVIYHLTFRADNDVAFTEPGDYSFAPISISVDGGASWANVP